LQTLDFVEGPEPRSSRVGTLHPHQVVVENSPTENGTVFGSKARKLVKRGDIPALLGLLSSPDAKERADAANVLSNPDVTSSSNEEILGRLRPLVRDVDAGVRAQAVFALWSRGAPDAADICLAALNDPDAFVRLFAASGFGRLQDRRAVPRLIQLLDDEEFLVRHNAALALGDLSDRSALSALQSRLDHERDRGVISAVKEAIAKLQATSAEREQRTTRVDRGAHVEDWRTRLLWTWPKPHLPRRSDFPHTWGEWITFIGLVAFIEYWAFFIDPPRDGAHFGHFFALLFLMLFVWVVHSMFRDD
jgi:HEAT repeats